MSKNGSPTPVFDSDDSSYVLVTLPIHAQFNVLSGAESNGASNGVNQLFFNDFNDFIGYINGASNGATNGATNGADLILEQYVHGKVKEMLIATESWTSREKLFESIGLSNQSFNREKYLDPLLGFGWIEKAFPENITNSKQRYKISESGKRVLSLIN
jgi:ATP-dependent DNA helicase RecG